MRRATLSLLLLLLLLPSLAGGREFSFANLTDLPGGPGSGMDPRINVHGDVAFFAGDDVWVYDASTGGFEEITELAGAPPTGWFPKLNDAGDVAMIDRISNDVWLWEAGTGTFTNLSALPDHPGNSQALDRGRVFDLNNAQQISFHSGDNNFGTIWLYDHASGSFEQVTGKPGGVSRGLTNYLNKPGQVLYSGFPDAYLYDPASGQTTNISDLPGGPSSFTDNLLLSDQGDVVYVSTDVTIYTASDSSFQSLASLDGFPASFTSSNRNDLNESGEIVFWKEDLYYYDPSDQSFTQLDGRPGIPSTGLEASINESGDIAFASGNDVVLAVPDADLDGVADRDDNCVEVANPGQEDLDAGSDDDTSQAGVQHYGDACDADLDDDGVVGPSDFFSVLRPCFGVELGATPQCAEADLDGDGVVGASDFFDGLRPAFGAAPGPGFSEP